MFVVTVDFEVAAGDAARFMELILANARASLKDEPGCRQFDVCRDPAHPGRVFLYEVYDDAAAFEAHNATAHFQSFRTAARDIVKSKSVRLYPEVWQ